MRFSESRRWSETNGDQDAAKLSSPYPTWLDDASSSLPVSISPSPCRPSSKCTAAPGCPVLQRERTPKQRNIRTSNFSPLALTCCGKRLEKGYPSLLSLLHGRVSESRISKQGYPNISCNCHESDQGHAQGAHNMLHIIIYYII